MAAAIDLVRAVGDRQLAIRGVFEQRVNGSWQPVDLTGATVTFRMVGLLEPHPVVVDWAAASIEDATAGLVYYAPLAADVDTEGEFLAWFRSTKAGLDLTSPVDGFRISIREIP